MVKASASTPSLCIRSMEYLLVVETYVLDLQEIRGQSLLLTLALDLLPQQWNNFSAYWTLTSQKTNLSASSCWLLYPFSYAPKATGVPVPTTTQVLLLELCFLSSLKLRCAGSLDCMCVFFHVQCRTPLRRKFRLRGVLECVIRPIKAHGTTIYTLLGLP